MRYTDSKATAHYEAIPEPTMHTVDIGEVSDDTASWWRSKAFEALPQFAMLHNLGSQFSVAFTVALTIPIHNCHGLTLQLPQPSLDRAKCPATSINCVPQDWAALYDNLSYYMTLSCNPETIIYSLCGSFWEPGVPCNLVSSWLHPILTCFLTRPLPRTAALWLGAAAGGLTPMILRRTRRGRPPLDPVAFPWTGCLQSFMDIAGTGPYLDQSKGQIWRVDVWRLLHLPTAEEDDISYNYPPRTPWEPCGKMQTTECALRVVSHLHCPRHQIRYRHWNWEVENSAAIEEEEPHVFPEKPLDQEASEQASIDIFRWFIINGEGFPPGKFYKDEWIACLADDEDIDEKNDEDDT
ncbi:hypothetical protein ASPFODRAFT_58616 [Aspergillus luchuensis CBS 106.47]|uniref:Uncharacterized protein n=1 Tax=Aspergillus luchuensis (strain CBS 106.47) TaxID=1137211 RepID=A0A1M3TTE9_ASPLC|nr:hypothetical protein ASPFODRAFT_58616 [Aspergillus luchuensis CBS 106.47]